LLSKGCVFAAVEGWTFAVIEINMKRTICFLLLFNLISLTSYPQLLNWAYKIGGNYSDECYDLAKDDEGNIYITGGFCNSVNFNPKGKPFVLQSSDVNNSNIFVAKYDHDFNLKWAFGIGNNHWEAGLSIKTDILKSVYISGNYRENVDFDPSPNTNVLNSVNMSYFLAKYDSNGQFQWVRDIGSDGNNYLTAPSRVGLFLDKSLNVYTYLQRNDTLRKFDYNGNSIWKREFSGLPVSDNTTSLFSIDNCKDPFEYEYNYQKTLIFNKIDTNGDFYFSKTVARTFDGFIGGYISYDITGNILLSGKFWGTVNFYGINDSLSISNYDAITYGPLAREFITKIDTFGNVKWVKYFDNNGPSPYIIKTNSNKEIFTLGFLNFSANFDPTGNVVLTNGGYGNYIAKYDSSFNYLACAEFLGGSYNDFIGGFELHGDTAVICGHFFNTIDLDLTNLTHFLSANPPEDIFVSQYSNFNITTNAASIDELPNPLLKVPVYPNPSNGNFCLKFDKYHENVDIIINNLMGQEIYSQKVCSNNVDINLSSYDSGIYFLTIIQGNKRMNSKLIIAK